jgi:putative N6-adenine-specific DNA methylase
MRHDFFGTCAKGTEGVLGDELRALGLTGVKGSRGGVHFAGVLDDGLRACLGSRVAMRILLLVGQGEARGADGLHERVASLPWEDHLDLQHTFAVEATVKSSELTHSHYVALRTKDAVCDRLRQRLGARPDVDPQRPDLLVRVHLDRDHLQVYLDLSGEPLHLRGWRTEAREAPLRETLAAAMLALGGYDPALPFCDPMCGSGTLVIEAAQVARRIAPGLARSRQPGGFAFQRWPAAARELSRALARLQDELQGQVLPSAPAPLLGRDLSNEALAAARANAARAGVSADVRLERRDARELLPLPPRCQLFVNPPYGERLGADTGGVGELYTAFGAAYERALAEARKEDRGATHALTVLSGSPLFEPSFGRRPASRHGLYNGPLEVALLRFGTGTSKREPSRQGASHAPPEPRARPRSHNPGPARRDRRDRPGGKRT